MEKKEKEVSHLLAELSLSFLDTSDTCARALACVLSLSPHLSVCLFRSFAHYNLLNHHHHHHHHHHRVFLFLYTKIATLQHNTTQCSVARHHHHHHHHIFF